MSDELPRPVRVYTPADLEAADPTLGMQRALAFELPLLWAGQVVTEPGQPAGPPTYWNPPPPQPPRPEPSS